MSKDGFLRVFSNLKEDLRKEIVVVIDKKPYSWNVAFDEISNDTDLGKGILKILEDTGLI